MVTPHLKITEKYYSEIQEMLAGAKSDKELFKVIVSAPFHDKYISTMLGLGIVVLLLADKKQGVINRIAISNNEMSKGTFAITSKPFKEIKIPINDRENYISIALKKNQPMITDDWHFLFTPELSTQDARFNQAGGGVACSAVYPAATVRDGAALIFSYFEPIDRIGDKHQEFMKKYIHLVAGYL